MNFRIKILSIMLASLIAAGCGSPGEPLPPSLELPRPVTDLRAARKGNAVTLTWTLPTLTTEGRTITLSGSFEVCRSLAPVKQCDTAVARIPFRKIARTKSASPAETYVDAPPSPPASDTTPNFYYAVSALNSYGRSAGLSNPVEVPAAPTLPPPENFQAQLTADGVRLTWSAIPNPQENPGLKFIYRVYRREAGGKTDAIAGEVALGNDASPSLLDHSFEWEKTYDYWITGTTLITEANGNGNEQQVEGDNSPTVRVVAHDVFPPATPVGVQAVFSGPGQKPFIDLVWSPNTDSDLAGYNVYRNQAGSQPVKINPELVKAPSYRDAGVLPGHEYVYRVSAVDVHGNESPQSEEAGESVPAQ